MISIPSQEVLQSVKKANHLTENFILPKNEWEKSVLYLCKFEIVLEDLISREIITKKQARILRREVEPLSYWSIFNSPDVQNNEKIKKSIKCSLYTNNLHRMGFSKSICILDSEFST